MDSQRCNSVASVGVNELKDDNREEEVSLKPDYMRRLDYTADRLLGSNADAMQLRMRTAPVISLLESVGGAATMAVELGPLLSSIRVCHTREPFLVA